MTEKTRVVLAGCGGIISAWLNTATVKDEVEIVGLVDVDIERAGAAAEKFALDGAVKGTDLEAVLEKTRPDAVFDCATPEAHYPITMAALSQGCHVLGEKPLADTMENARRMTAAAQKAGKVFAVIQNRRYQPQIRSLSLIHI